MLLNHVIIHTNIESLALDTNAFLQAARGQDSIEDTIDNSDDETRRRRSWTREQKLGAIKYATSFIYYIKYI